MTSYKKDDKWNAYWNRMIREARTYKATLGLCNIVMCKRPSVGGIYCEVHHDKHRGNALKYNRKVRMAEPPNKWGCKVHSGHCLEHDLTAKCAHGCEQIKGHECGKDRTMTLRRNEPANRWGCKPTADVCVEHDEDLTCKHGCSHAKAHECKQLGTKPARKYYGAGKDALAAQTCMTSYKKDGASDD